MAGAPPRGGGAFYLFIIYFFGGVDSTLERGLGGIVCPKWPIIVLEVVVSFCGGPPKMVGFSKTPVFGGQLKGLQISRAQRRGFGGSFWGNPRFWFFVKLGSNMRSPALARGRALAARFSDSAIATLQGTRSDHQ